MTPIPLHRFSYSCPTGADRQKRLAQQGSPKIRVLEHFSMTKGRGRPDVDGEVAVDFDHHSEEFNLNELAVNAELRRRCPVAWNQSVAVSTPGSASTVFTSTSATRRPW